MKGLVSLLLIAIAVQGFGLCPCYEPITNPYIAPYLDTCACCRFCNGRYELSAELIAFQPAQCSQLYAILDHQPIDSNDPSLPRGQSIALNPNISLGFRGSIGYVTESCQDFRLNYTWFHHQYHASFQPDDGHKFWPALGQPLGLGQPLHSESGGRQQARAQARSSLHIDFDSVDLQVGMRATTSCSLCTRRYVSVHWFELEHRHASHYKGCFEAFDGHKGPGTLKEALYTETRKLWGVGPQLGLEGQLPLVCGLGATAEMWAAITAGRQRGQIDKKLKVDLSEERPPISALLQDELKASCLVVPAIDAKLGLYYGLCFNQCFKVFLQVGYEILYYFDALRSQIFHQREGAINTVLCHAFCLSGVYARLTVKF